MMHNGGNGWGGVWWMILGALVLVGLAVWFSRRRSSKLGPRPYTYIFEGMGLISVTPIHTDTQGVEHDVTKETADKRAYGLEHVYRRTWRECTRVYGWGRQHWPIEKIGIMDGIVHKDHPHVLWNAPVPTIMVRLQDGMRSWFAREIHNVFRYTIHGMKHIYKTIDDRDLMRAQEITFWIEREFGGPKC